MLYRIVVMGMLVAVIGMAWKVYGPPMETAIDLVQEAAAVADKVIVLSGSTEPTNPNGEMAEPSAVGPVAGRPGEPHPDSLVQPASVSLTPTPEVTLPVADVATNAVPAVPVHLSSNTQPSTGQLLAQLIEQGMTEHRLEPWGNQGELYRFSCRVAPADNPLYARHFEMVAADAESAVAQVAAEVAAWRGAATRAR